MECGLRYVYLGNVHNYEASSTFCHNCGEILIGRDWYELSDWNLDGDGTCISCGIKCMGQFDGPRGTWGRKRQPLEIYKRGSS